MNCCHRRLWVVLVVAALLVGCTGTGGFATGQVQSCRASGGEGWCEGSYRTIQGRYTYEIEDVPVARGQVVHVLAAFGVQEGALKVAVTGPDGQQVEAAARPGEPARLDGLAMPDSDGAVPIVLEVAEGEKVEGVEYVVEWRVE